MKTRLIAALVDLLLDYLCALLVPVERSPGLRAPAERAQDASRNIFVRGNHG